MKYLTILAVLTLACSGEDITPRQCHSMTLSDANPVQFWPIDCETWNESRPKGVHHYCFCQPFECDDHIQVQFSDDPGSFMLRVFDESEAQIAELPFASISDEDSEGADIVFDLSSFTNEDIPLIPGAIAWTLGSTPSVTLPTPALSSKRLKKTVGSLLPAGTYKVRYNVSMSPSIASANAILEPLVFLDGSDIGIESAPILNGSHDVMVTFPDDVNSITFTFVSGDSGSGTVNVNSLKFIPIGFRKIYSTGFIPEDEGICDQKIRLSIYRTEGRSIELSPLSAWINKNTGGTAWTTGATPSINIPGLDITDELSTSAVAAGSGAGNYSFEYDISATVISVGMYMFVKCYKVGSTIGSHTEFITSTSQSGTILINCSDEPDEVTIKFFHDGPGATVVTVNDFEPSAAVEVYKSDCLDIKVSHNESLLINYSNHNNFAGIEYPDITPDPSFNIRIPAIFFIDRYPQEGEDFTLSNNTVLALNSQVKLQRQLSTDRMPKYMHKKMVLVLQHQFLYIDGEYWIKGQEEYSKSEKKNKRDSFDMYTCWLTNKNFVVRNIL